MVGGDVFHSFEVGDGAGDLEDTGVGQGGKDVFFQIIDDSQAENSCQGMAWLFEGRSMVFLQSDPETRWGR